MLYPQRLVPQESDRIIEHKDIDGAYNLGVWVESNVQLKLDNGELNPEAIIINRLAHYSTNKIPESQIDDLAIKFICDPLIIDTYNQLWTEGNKGLEPLDDHFIFDKARQFFFLKIAEINGYSQDYQKPPGSENNYVFTILVRHVPTMTNYWHFELFASNENGPIKRLDDTGWKKVIAQSMLQKIQKVAKF